MTQDHPLSDEALRSKREAFDVSRRELTVKLEQVILELSESECPILTEIIKDLKDITSSKLDIQEALQKLLNGEIRTSQYEAERIQNLEPRIREFCENLTQLYHLYVFAITQQGGRVRSLRTERISQTVLERAEERLKALKADYLSDTGEEWSDVREEGPIILTKNLVRGNEISPELSDIVRHLKSEKTMRYLIMDFYNRYDLMFFISARLGRSCTSQEPTETRTESQG